MLQVMIRPNQDVFREDVIMKWYLNSVEKTSSTNVAMTMAMKSRAT